MPQAPRHISLTSGPPFFVFAFFSFFFPFLSRRYNHHYGMSISGKGASSAAKNFDPEAPVTNTHGGPHWVHTPNGEDSGQGFYAQSMSEHNGNEARQTYHGMPPGYVVPIESPTTWHMTAMQINTKNPDGSGAESYF